MMINEEKVIEIVQSSLKLDSDSITINSSSENIDEWNSLEHLSILVAIDEELKGKAGEIDDLAKATSVRGILDAINKHYSENDG